MEVNVGNYFVIVSTARLAFATSVGISLSAFQALPSFHFYFILFSFMFFFFLGGVEGGFVLKRLHEVEKSFQLVHLHSCMTPLNFHPRKFLGIAQTKKFCVCDRNFSYGVNKVWERELEFGTSSK
jgi:hypothetical protein